MSSLIIQCSHQVQKLNWEKERKWIDLRENSVSWRVEEIFLKNESYKETSNHTESSRERTHEEKKVEHWAPYEDIIIINCSIIQLWKCYGCAMALCERADFVCLYFVFLSKTAGVLGAVCTVHCWNVQYGSMDGAAGVVFVARSMSSMLKLLMIYHFPTDGSDAFLQRPYACRI